MQNKLTVLIAGVWAQLSTPLTQALTAKGYRTITAENGSTAVSMVSSHCPDLVLLKHPLSDSSGLDVLQTIRKWSSVPVLVLAAKGSESEEIHALQLGADDYLAEPLSLPKLLARIQTAFRHSLKTEAGGLTAEVLQVGSVSVDLCQRSVTVRGQKTHLTQNEYKIFLLLARNPGRVLPYSDMIKAVWGHFAADDRQILRVNIANIRRKIEPDPANPSIIVTEIGVGYRLSL